MTPQPSSRRAARILIVDDHAMFRVGVKLFLQRYPELQVIAEAADAETALALAAKERPDLVLLDLDLAGFDALDIIGPLRQAAPDSRIMVLTGIRNAELQLRAVHLGASGFVSKEQSADLLLRAIRKVLDGELWFDHGTVATALTTLLRTESDAASPLTPREREIVHLIGEGMTNEQIALHLAIKEKTVRNRLTVIFEKVGVRDRLHLAVYAYRHGLAKLPH